MNVRRISAAVVVSVALGVMSAALPASAAEWMPWDGQDASAPRAIYTQDSEERGALLVCKSDGTLSAMISLSPADMPALLAKNAPYARSAKATVAVGDQDAVETTFRYIPAIDTVETREHLIAAKVFNAAVMGEPLNISVKREGDIQASLPVPDDTFKAFAKTCKTLREGTAD